MKQNCWEFKKCGREPGGAKTTEYGVCPAVIAENINKIHNGTNGGRACWAITGTLCGGQVQGTFAAKFGNCIKCDFYKQVCFEEGQNMTSSIEISKMLKN